MVTVVAIDVVVLLPTIPVHSVLVHPFFLAEFEWSGRIGFRKNRMGGGGKIYSYEYEINFVFVSVDNKEAPKEGFSLKNESLPS